MEVNHTQHYQALLEQLGCGFNRSSLIRFQQFYLAYPKGATLLHLFSWSHTVKLLKIDDPLELTLREAQDG